MKITGLSKYCVACLLLCCWGLAQASVTASIDKNPVVQGQAVTLTLRVVDEDGEPDLTALSGDFRVLSQSTSSQVQFVNGSVSRWKDWVIQLLPTKTGQLTIPAIPVGNARSSAIQLTVAKASTAGSKEAWVEFSVTPERAWQGQQLLVDVVLYYASSVRTGELSAPEVSGAILEQVGEDKPEQTVKNGVRYNRLSRRYVVFPERAGPFEIGAPVFNGQAEAPSAPSRSFGGLFRNTRHIAAAAKSVTVNVQPALTGADFWLPAQDVSLNSSWGSSKDSRPTFRVGEPVTRVVTLTAYGLLATQLPDLQFDYPDLRAYPEAAEQETRGSSQGVVGVRHYRSALIPQQAGAYELPEVAVKWWDVSRGEWATAVLPAETITVLPPAQAATPLVAESEPCESTPLLANAAEDKQAEVENSCDGTDALAPPQEASYWRWWAIVATTLWLVTLLWPWLKAHLRRRRSVLNKSESDVAAAKRAVITACRQHQQAPAAKALAGLAKTAGLAVFSPAAVAQQLGGGPLADELKALDAACYGGAKAWDGEALAAALEAHEWPLDTSSKAKNPLPELYPQ